MSNQENEQTTDHEDKLNDEIKDKIFDASFLDEYDELESGHQIY